jgi:heavy metal sensor kinase
MKLSFPKSIRWRLQLWLAFLLVCVLTGFAVTAYRLHRTNRFEQIDQELERRVVALSADLRWRPFPGERPGRPPPDDPVRPPLFHPRPDFPGRRGFPEPRPGPRDIRLSTATSALFDEGDTNGFYFAVWSRDGTLLKQSTNAPAQLPLPVRSGSETRIRTRTRGELREVYHHTERADCVLAGRVITPDLAAMRRFTLWLLMAGGLVLGVGLGGGWWLTVRAIRPVEEISAAASRISAGNLSERITVANPDNELGSLAEVLNSTFARLEAAFAQQKQFTADASHELRTPLAVLISEAQTTLARDRSAPEYRAAVEACLDTAQQMRRLTESLLDLARYDAGQDPLRSIRFDLAEKASEAAELAQTIAAARGIRIHAELETTICFGDPERISQVILNLLTNAIYYNRDGGEVRVSTRNENGEALLAVSDTGIGISAGDLPHLFERFYRADKSRSRSDGRSGLGLSICQVIVESHGGRISVSSEPGAGSTFSVYLPARSPA